MRANLWLVFVLIWPATCRAQLTLNAGDQYTFYFSGLPDVTIGEFGFSPSGGLSFNLSDFDRETDQLYFDMFEETPEVLSGAGGIAEATVDSTALPDAFSDFDGGVVFEMLAGSVTLQDITFFFQEPIGPTESRRFARTLIPTPIPEPASVTLLLIALLMVFARRLTARLGCTPFSSSDQWEST